MKSRSRRDQDAGSPAVRRRLVAWLNALAFGLFLVSAVGTAGAQASEEQVADPTADVLAAVRIEGNATIPQHAISQHVKTRPGRPVSPKQVKDDVEALVRTRWFTSVEPIYRQTDEGVVLVFRVWERPIVKDVQYKGNVKLKTKKLESITGLRVGSPYDVSANRECARRLESEYHEKGYTFATVALEKGDSRDDREVVFLIEEGPKVAVRTVEFHGNEFVSAPVLHTKLATKARWRLIPYGPPLPFGGKYDPSTIPDDITSLKQYYTALGFFDVQVSERVEFNEDRSRITLHYDIEEGPRYAVRNIEFAGNRVFTNEELGSDLKLASGKPFNARDLNKDLTEIRGRYGEQGRIFTEVEAVPRFLEDPGMVDLVFRVKEDKVRYVRRINVHIEGENPHTQTMLPLNYSMIAPGDLADPKQIQRTRSRLGGNQVFEARGPEGPRVDVKPVEQEDWFQPALFRELREAEETNDDAEEPVVRGQNPQILREYPGSTIYDPGPQGNPLGSPFMEEPPGWVDLDYHVTEARTGRLMFGVGVNSDSGVVGNIVLTETNFDITRVPTSWNDVWNGTAFRGAGQRFRIEALPGSRVSRYMINWQDPFFMDTDYTLGLSGFYYTRFFRNWTEERLGGRITVGRQLTQEISVAGALRLENVNISDLRTLSPPELVDVEGDNFLSTFRLSASHDTRDAPFLPGEGHFAEISYEQAFGDFTYPRFEAEATQYWTLFSRPDGGGRHILSARGQLGWTGDDTPIFEEFYAGGFQTFRGFDFRGVGPHEFGAATGGNWMMLGGLEYLMPLTADENIGMVFFSDFGTVDESVDLSDFRVSVGTGLRLTIPAMGPVPIALDWAFPLMKEDDDERRIFSFYVGITR